MKAKSWLVVGLGVVNAVLVSGLVCRGDFSTPKAQAAVNLQGVHPLTVAGRSGQNMVLWMMNTNNGLLTAIETPGNNPTMGQFSFTRSVTADIQRVKTHIR